MEKDLDPQKAITLVEKLQREEVERMRNDPTKAHLLGKFITPTFYIFKKVLFRKFLMIGLLNLTEKAIQIGAIFLLDRVTDSIKDYDQNDKSTIGMPILYLSLMTVVYSFGTYIDSRNNNVQNQFTMIIKTIGQYLIYQKALKTKYLQETIQKKKQKEGEQANKEEKKDGDEEHTANVNNLLTVDIDELQAIRWGVFEFFSSIITITVVIYFLYVKLGKAMIKGLIFFVVAIIINAIVSSLCIFFYRRALKFKDERIGLSTDVIEGMKQIKYLSWENTFNDKILKLRKKEFLMITCQKSVDTLNNVYWSSISYMLLYVFLSSYISYGNDLQDTNIFTIIALFNLLTFPMGVLPYCISQFISIRVSYKRIKTFLDIDEISPDDVIRERTTSETEYVIEIPPTTFRWPVKKSKDGDVNNTNKANTTQVGDVDGQDETYTFQFDIDELKIKKNTLTMVIGRIGSGKTALLNVILNEMDSFNYKNQEMGRSVIRGTIAYVSQNHWLQNMSIRDNILFGKPFDKQLYMDCIKSCELVQDLLTFPKGDQLILGPDAKNISGGQKQRISLCRALYQDCDTYLLDDVFSSLDMHVADAVFQRVVKELFLGRGKTVVMITSQFRFIDMSDKCNILYVDSGKIQTDPDLIAQFMSQENSKQAEQEEKQHQNEINELPAMKKRQSSNTESAMKEFKAGDDEDEEERQSGEIAMDTVYYYMSQMTWLMASGFLFFSIVLILSRNLIDFWLRYRITPGDTTFNFLDDWFGNDFESVFASLIGINVAITVMEAGLMTSCTLVSGWRIFKKLNSSIMNSTMIFFDKNAQGRIVNRIANDTLVVDDELPWFAGIFVNSLLACIGYPMGIVILFPWMLVIIIAELVFFWALQKKFRKSNRDLKRIQSVNEGKIISHLTESTSGLRVIRSFEKQEHFITEYIQKLRHSLCSLIASNKCGYWLGVRLQMLSNLIFVSVSLTIIFLMLIGAHLDYSTCAMTLTYAVLIANSFNETMTWFTSTEAKMVSVERIKQYFNNPQEVIDLVKVQPQVQQIVAQRVPPSLESITTEQLNENAIIFNDVTLTYDDVTLPEIKFALKKFSLKIRKGEKIAFVGRTGSGKTSILNILFRLYDFQQGEIFVNGQNIQQMKLHDVRLMMSVVPQFGFLYNATLKDNIDPQGLLNDKQIEDAFNKTGFKIRGIMENNVQSNDNETNINFMIAKSGSNLSNGERQVINFMRIILQNKDIVCLDEATSNMDPKTDEELHNTLFEYTADKTLIVITHRLENIKMYDRIVVLESGQIAEIGTYDELMMKEDGLFVKLVQLKQ